MQWLFQWTTHVRNPLCPHKLRLEAWGWPADRARGAGRGSASSPQLGFNSATSLPPPPPQEGTQGWGTPLSLLATSGPRKCLAPGEAGPRPLPSWQMAPVPAQAGWQLPPESSSFQRKRSHLEIRTASPSGGGEERNCPGTRTKRNLISPCVSLCLGESQVWKPHPCHSLQGWKVVEGRSGGPVSRSSRGRHFACFPLSFLPCRRNGSRLPPSRSRLPPSRPRFRWIDPLKIHLWFNRHPTPQKAMPWKASFPPPTPESCCPRLCTLPQMQYAYPSGCGGL